MTNVSINTFALRFLRGDFIDTDCKTQIEAGWYDWFCRDTSLANKTKVLGAKVLQLMNSNKIDPENNYVFFKNNCPVDFSLYDDFRICDIKTGNVIYTIVPKHSHNGLSAVYGHENHFSEPLVSGSWKDVKNFFGVK